MRPKPVPAPADGETDLFRNRLENMIDMRHELVLLALLIDWQRFEDVHRRLRFSDFRAGDDSPLRIIPCRENQKS